MIWFLSITAVLYNVAAQVSIKLANQADRTVLKESDAWISPWLTLWIIAVIALYSASYIHIAKKITTKFTKKRRQSFAIVIFLISKKHEV